MPTYVYECAKCGDEIEEWQSFTDEPLKKHSGCGGKLAKVIQPAGIVLKGSGFYKNDSRGTTPKHKKGDGESEKTSESVSAGSDKGSSDKGSSGSDTKTESKSTDTKKSSDSKNGSDSGAKRSSATTSSTTP